MSPPLTWSTMTFPPDFDPSAGEAWLRSLASQRLFRMVDPPAPVVVEVSSTSGGLVWQLGLPARWAEGFLASLRALAPGVRVIPAERLVNEVSYGWEVRLQHPFIPIRTDMAEQASNEVLRAVHRSRGAGTVLLQWVIGGAVVRKREKLPRANRPDDPLALVADLALDRDDVQALRAKQQEPVFACLGRIVVGGVSGARGRELAAQIFGALELTRAPGSGFKRRLFSGTAVAKRATNLTVPWGAWPCALNASELAAVIGWPYGGPVLGGVTYGGQRQLPAAESVVSQERPIRSGRVFGEATYPGREGYLVQGRRDSTLHTWVLGPSGLGKSTLLGNLALQDIAQGRGTIVIEPKGDLVRDILARLDRSRLDDVVVLDASDPVAVVGINPLKGADREVAVDGILTVLKGLFGENFGPRTTDLVHAALLTLTYDPNASLIGLPLLLTDPRYQQRLVPKASKADPWGLAPFWAWYSGLSDDQRSVVLAPVMNKLRSILLRGALRRVLGQSAPRFRLEQVFTERKVLLVSLASGSIGSEGAALLGSLLVSHLWQVIQRRSRIPAERRHPVGLFIDEFQNYLHLPTDLADVLAQARGLGVGVVAAHQHLGQLTGPVRSAMLANAQSRVLFRLTGEDASAMARTTRELDVADLEGLGRYETYVSLVSGGAATPYASARMLALPDPVRDPNVAIELSRARWGTPVDDIDAAHRALVEPPAPTSEPSVGARRRRGGSS